jgi:hypothetical protein
MEEHHEAVDLWVLHMQGSLFASNFLAAYFEGIADIENNTAKELVKLGGVIQVPFRAGNQFLGDGGLQVRCT